MEVSHCTGIVNDISCTESDSVSVYVTKPTVTLLLFLFLLCTPTGPTALKWPSAAVIAGTPQDQAPTLDPPFCLFVSL